VCGGACFATLLEADGNERLGDRPAELKAEVKVREAMSPRTIQLTRADESKASFANFVFIPALPMVLSREA
jgi:hypothetical protein